LKIVVNTRLLQKNRLDGIFWFSYYSLKYITQKYSEHQFYFIFDRKFDKSFIFSDNIEPIILPPPTRHPLIFPYWFEIALAGKLKKLNPDIFLSPDGYLSLRSKVIQLPVIHDINFFHNPQDIPFSARSHYNYFFPKYAQKAKRIATVSEFSKSDIVNSYKINPEKIDVVYNGASEIYIPLSESEKNKIKANYSNSTDYFIFVGSLSPRKNVENLFKAFDIFKNKTGSVFKLMIVGSPMHKTSGIFQTFSSLIHKKDIIFTGKLEEDILHKVLAASSGLTFVPYFEGFGIPILEAMYCEVPVICSNLTSMPEVAGDAGLLVNPYDTQEIASAMETLANNKQFASKLIENARLQRTKFSHTQTAEKLWQSIETCIHT